MPDISVSLSAVQAYRACRQKYFYNYIEDLKPRVASAPMDLGTVLHEYLERYYEHLQAETPHAEAHTEALAFMRKRHEPYLLGIARTAKAMGSWDVAEEFGGMLDKAARLAERYYVVHGISDAERYEILLIERRLRARIAPGIISNGKADLVARDRLSGQVLMWEHKSTKTIPSHGYRLRDLQTVLYIVKLRLIKYHATGVLWNYVRTVAPKVPELNKNGKMDRTKIDSTWEVYRQAVIDAGLNPNDYADMQQKLLGAEEEKFFPRFEYTNNEAVEHIFLEDYRQTALEIAADRIAWEAGERRPVRTQSRDCDYCPYNKLCTAVLTGKNDDLVKQQWFTTPAERKAEYGSENERTSV